MKKLGLTLMIAALVLQGMAQGSANRLSVLEEMESNRLPEGMMGDTLDISYRDSYQYTAYSYTSATPMSEEPVTVTEEKEISFYNDEPVYSGNYRYEYQYQEEDRTSFGDVISEWNSNRKKFKGHWVGFGGGFSNYITGDMQYTMPAPIEYMTLNSGKSFNYHLNFTQLSVGLTRHVGFVTGLGVSWDNFRFEGQNNIQKNEGAPNSAFYFDDPADNNMIKKSTLNVVYLNLPVLLEIQFPAGWNTLNLSAGPFGAVKIGSWSKIVLEGGDKFKNDSDFNFNMLMAGATVRLGFEDIQAYANYYLTPLFLTDKTPGGIDLYTFDVGLSISF